jgi:uncharacterized protein (DUF1810 family)
MERFVEAQENTYAAALQEIKAGQKTSHWMWYIFPQIQGLGYSAMSKLYAIKNIAEATEYLAHPILGARLMEICNALLELEDENATAIFGITDAAKLKSCMTLFNEVPDADTVFEKVLCKYFECKKDKATLEILEL